MLGKAGCPLSAGIRGGLDLAAGTNDKAMQARIFILARLQVKSARPDPGQEFR